MGRTGSSLRGNALLDHNSLLASWSRRGPHEGRGGLSQQRISVQWLPPRMYFTLSVVLSKYFSFAPPIFTASCQLVKMIWHPEVVMTRCSKQLMPELCSKCQSSAGFARFFVWNWLVPLFARRLKKSGKNSKMWHFGKKSVTARRQSQCKKPRRRRPRSYQLSDSDSAKNRRIFLRN